MLISQRKLNQFLDEELEPNERRELEAAMAEHPELQAKLEILKAVNNKAQKEYESLILMPVSSKLLDAI